MFKDRMQEIWLDRELCFYTNLLNFISIFNINQGILGNLRIITPITFDDGYLHLLYTFFTEQECVLINTIRNQKNIFLYQIINTFFFKIGSLFEVDFNKFYKDKSYISSFFLGISNEEYKNTPIERLFNISMEYKIEHFNLDELETTKAILYKFISMCKEYTKQKLTLPKIDGIQRTCDSVIYYIKPEKKL